MPILTFKQSLTGLLLLAICLIQCTTPNPPEETNPSKSVYAITTDQLHFEVSPEFGGRIASFQWEGVEFLKTSRDSNHLQWGSTIWPAPQSDWNWPPPKGMDVAPYEVIKQSETEIILKSQLKAYKGLQVEKAFQLNEAKNGVDITYTFVNKGTDTIRTGIWEISRIAPVGTAYWQSPSSDSLHQKVIDQHPKPKDKLFIEEASGWLAYNYKNALWIKSFPVATKSEVAPEQAPIEIYIDYPDQFAELEEHGPYLAIPPSGTQSLQVKWQAYTLADQKAAAFLNNRYGND